MICFTLLQFENFNISGGLYITQSKIYDGAYIAKIVSRYVYAQKSSIVDVRLGSEYAFCFLKTLQKVYFFKVYLLLKFVYSLKFISLISLRLLKFVIFLKYITSFNSSNILLNIYSLNHLTY